MTYVNVHRRDGSRGLARLVEPPEDHPPLVSEDGEPVELAVVVLTIVRPDGTPVHTPGSTIYLLPDEYHHG